ncbi:hypothetical protein SO802_029294 [Lithocarpus litseifolius]|uniref:Uncharacterized protein n=1 Tax=Lithocarpus litseifolius TaxID=425828 RepID=A0AAW2BYG0_9ROSI
MGYRAGVFSLLILSLAKDPCLLRINVAIPGFLLPEGALIPGSTLLTQPILEHAFTVCPIPEGVPKVGASSSRPLIKESRRVAVVKAFEVAKKKSQDLVTKLAEAERDKKSAKAALDVVERRLRPNKNQLRQAEDELVAAKGSVASKCGTRPLDRAGVEAFSALRSAKNVYYPPAIHASGSSSSKADSASKVVNEGKDSPSKILPLAEVSFEVAKQTEDAKKVDDALKEPAKNAPKGPVKEKEASQCMEIVLTSLPLPPKEDPKGKGPSLTTADSTQPPKTQKDKLVIKMKS